MADKTQEPVVALFTEVLMATHASLSKNRVLRAYPAHKQAIGPSCALSLQLLDIDTGLVKDVAV